VLAMPVAGILNTLLQYGYEILTDHTPKDEELAVEAS